MHTIAKVTLRQCALHSTVSIYKHTPSYKICVPCMMNKHPLKSSSIETKDKSNSG